LKAAVYLKTELLVKTQVGSAKSTEAEKLKTDCREHCALILDTDNQFWGSLEQLAGDIEVICYATNLSQKDSARADQTPSAWLEFSFISCSTEPDLSTEMIKRIEKRWKECDQILFLLALILNPWEQLSSFGEDANCAMEEEMYMCVMAELEAENDTLDNGAIEIDDDEVWGN
jgi:hypothetical protein